MAPLVILGASTRAAAHSALRAGLIPHCADLFADRDLAALCSARAVPRTEYPHGLARFAEEAPSSPWLYTGALENYPDLIERIARARPLWGNHAEVLRGVRDPLTVQTKLRAAGVPVPRARLDPQGLPRDGSWLVKPLASAGGQGIHPLEAGFAASARAVYYQERIAGPSFSAIFVGYRNTSVLIGASRQWTGRPGAPYAYVGSIGPWPISQTVVDRLDALGRAMVRTWGVLGLFGVDFILRDGVPWPVEINPRYTASVEVLELSLGRALLAEHRRAFEVPNGSPAGLVEPDVPHRGRCVGKLVVFAPCQCTFPDEIAWSSASWRPFAVPTIADVPSPGTFFDAGDPVLTVFASGRSAAICEARLLLERARWHRVLRATPAPVPERPPAP